jgi:hypothetical protein
LIDLENKFLENLHYRVTLKKKIIKPFKKFPDFTSELEKSEEELVNVQLRDKYQIIIEELDNLMKKNQ